MYFIAHFCLKFWNWGLLSNQSLYQLLSDWRTTSKCPLLVFCFILLELLHTFSDFWAQCWHTVALINVSNTFSWNKRLALQNLKYRRTSLRKISTLKSTGYEIYTINRALSDNFSVLNIRNLHYAFYRLLNMFIP